MAEITWVKILTNIRRNKKMLLLKALPEGDALFCIWIDLICIAGELNDRGFVYINPEIPYTDEELGTVLDRPPVIIRLALNTFLHYKMVEIDDSGFIMLTGFADIQDIEGMERVRELGAARSRKWREAKRETKALPEGRNVTQRDSNGTDKIREDKNKEEIWVNILIRLKEAVNEKNFFAWFDGAICFEINDSEFVIGVKREDQAAYLEKNQRGLIENIISIVTGSPLKLKVLLVEN